MNAIPWNQRPMLPIIENPRLYTVRLRKMSPTEHGIRQAIR